MLRIFAGFGILVMILGSVQGGTGGVIIEGSFGGAPSTFNPILANDPASTQIARFLFPSLIGIDPAVGNFRKNDPYALASDWAISDDGRVYTFQLQDDRVWSDGTPITTTDILYFWNALNSGLIASPADYLPRYIEKLEAPDDFTLVATFKSADCAALNYLNALQPVPAHALPADFNMLNTADFNLNPTVTGGLFSFGGFKSGQGVRLIANPNLQAKGFIYKSFADQMLMVDQFLNGEINVITNPPLDRRADILEMGDVQVYEYPGSTWDFLALNIADPASPQSAIDSNGQPVEQGLHPLFGDVRVRRAIALAIDIDALIEKSVQGFGTRMPSFTIPSSWAFDATLMPIPHNLEQAIALLEESGWRDTDGDGIRDQNGIPFSFSLNTNLGGIRRDNLGALIAEQLGQVGIQAHLEVLDFDDFITRLYDQTFDAAIFGWRGGYPDDPDQSFLFTPAADVLGSGTNFVSYNNAEVTTLMEQARTLLGCDPSERAVLYHQIQAILQTDLPYIPLFALDEMYAAHSTVNGFNPYPNALYWNIDTWSVTP